MKSGSKHESRVENVYRLEGRVPVSRAIPFGLQHVLAMFVANVAPLIIIASVAVYDGQPFSAVETARLIQNCMLIAGIGTLVQLYPLWRIGSGLPIVMGLSFTFLAACMAAASRDYGIMIGAIIVGGLFEGVLGLTAHYWRKIISPLLSSCVVVAIGLSILNVGAEIHIGNAMLRITQIGKECHDHCAIYYSVGRCVMPESGYFCEVISSGTISTGDIVTAEYVKETIPMRACIITLADRAFDGDYEDRSGPVIEEKLKDNGYDIVERLVLPDDYDSLSQNLTRLCDQRFPDLIVTTGGTGFSPRDITPEATLSVADRNVPGISEAIRAESMKVTKNAMLSRAVSVIRKKTLIVNLPGSPKACLECMDIFLDVIPHGLYILRGNLRE